MIFRENKSFIALTIFVRRTNRYLYGATHAWQKRERNKKKGKKQLKWEQGWEFPKNCD
jgi:hypothetical protein